MSLRTSCLALAMLLVTAYGQTRNVQGWFNFQDCRGDSLICHDLPDGNCCFNVGRAFSSVLLHAVANPFPNENMQLRVNSNLPNGCGMLQELGSPGTCITDGDGAANTLQWGSNIPRDVFGSSAQSVGVEPDTFVFASGTALVGSHLLTSARPLNSTRLIGRQDLSIMDREEKDVLFAIVELGGTEKDVPINIMEKKSARVI